MGADELNDTLMLRKPHYWVLKSEPSEYSFDQLQKDRKTLWTGIRNFEARNNIRTMHPGDLALYYHSGEGKNIVGIARITSEARPDPTAGGEDWSCVEIEPLAPLAHPVALADLKKNASFREFPLVRRGRLSVVPVTEGEFQTILKLSATHVPPGQYATKTPH
jgi:predicted RNA-binding protein with PUA-like domain